jgi:hypothetical protein
MGREFERAGEGREYLARGWQRDWRWCSKRSRDDAGLVSVWADMPRAGWPLLDFIERRGPLPTVGCRVSTRRNDRDGNSREARRSHQGSGEMTSHDSLPSLLLSSGFDVIVSNYEEAPGNTSPREVADVRLHVLKAAVLEGSNGRHGTAATDFEQLLEP